MISLFSVNFPGEYNSDFIPKIRIVPSRINGVYIDRKKNVIFSTGKGEGSDWLAKSSQIISEN